MPYQLIPTPERSPHHDALLAPAILAVDSPAYDVRLRVCDKPGCPCPDILIQCTPHTGTPDGDQDPETEPVLAFFLDVAERRRVDIDEYSPEERRLSDSVTESLTDDNWTWLREYFGNSKKQLFEKMDVDRIDVKFPPDIVEDPGRMMAYSEMFPWAKSLEFHHQGGFWLLDDQYCTKPHCDCSEARLEFMRIPTEEARSLGNGPHEVSSAASIYLNPRTLRSAEAVSTPGNPSPHALLKSARAAHPNLEKTFLRRQSHIRRLADRLLFEEDNADSFSTTYIRDTPKTGRNDPCPCGSGRKFKQCCGKPA